MKTKTKSHIDSIYKYDRRIRLNYLNAKQVLSEENYALFESYDRSMVREALSKALRTKHLQTIITLSKMIDKNWVDVDSQDIDDLVFRIMDIYADEKGQESHTSYDMKKILR